MLKIGDDLQGFRRRVGTGQWSLKARAAVVTSNKEQRTENRSADMDRD